VTPDVSRGIWCVALLMIALMAKGYRAVVRDQPFVFPPDMREWVLPDHPVCMVMTIVKRLDTSAFHQRRRVGGVGRAGYDPDTVLTVLIGRGCRACGRRGGSNEPVPTWFGIGDLRR
jgi:hypothetical protein